MSACVSAATAKTHKDTFRANKTKASRNMHTQTFEQGHRECRPKASASQVARTGACASK